MSQVSERVPQDGEKNEAADTVKDERNHTSSGSMPEQAHENSKNSGGNTKGDAPADGLEETSSVLKPREVKGIEASHSLKCANNPGKKNKLDQHKEAMLGKKRNRQTVFLNLEEVKQAGPIKTSTPRRHSFSSTLGTRTVKEIRTIPAPPERNGEKQGQPVTKDQKQIEGFCNEGSSPNEYENKVECNGDIGQGSLARSKKLGTGDSSSDYPPPVPMQGSWKHPAELTQPKNQQGSTRKPALIGHNKEMGDIRKQKACSFKKAKHEYYSISRHFSGATSSGGDQ